MRASLRCTPLVVLLLAPLCTRAADPSGGWLSYAIFEANATDVITKLSATMSVPDAPVRRGAEPAFWFGKRATDGPTVVPYGLPSALDFHPEQIESNVDICH